MYYELLNQMFKNRVSIMDLSKELKLTRNTVSNKIRGKAKFLVDEMITIKNKFFPDVLLDILCRKEQEWEPAMYFQGKAHRFLQLLAQKQDNQC